MNHAGWLRRFGPIGLAGALAFTLGAMAGDGGPGWELPLLAATAVGLVLATAPLATAARLARALPASAANPPGGRTGRRDALTGLAGASALEDRLLSMLAGARRGDRATALLMIDIADFAGINRSLGHAAGDLLLRQVGTRLLASTRTGDLVARILADRFAIVQRGPRGPADAAQAADRLLETLAEPFDLFGRPATITARIGIALAPEDGTEPESLIGRAEQALALAKTETAPTARFADRALDRALAARRALARDLAGALERGEIEIHYQPQIDLGSRRLVGVEAWPLWLHPSHGRIAPTTFREVAATSGLGDAIGRFVLETAGRRAATWRRGAAAPLRLTIDLAAAQLHDPGLPDTIATILAGTTLPAEGLTLALDEGLVVDHRPAIAPLLDLLRASGIGVAVTGFGAEHGALAALHGLPVDEVVLDPSLVGALAEDPAALALLRAVLTLTRELGLTTTAAGVTTLDQLTRLDAEGCRRAQGPFFGPALHPHEVDAWIASGGAAELQPDRGAVNSVNTNG